MDFDPSLSAAPEQSAPQVPAAAAAEPAKIKRQPLSCLKCRQRKVKCDRVKPCQACCVRGQPRECDFAVGENDDSGPINQAHEIRRLREENRKLRTANLKYRDQRSEDQQQQGSNEQQQQRFESDESASPERRTNAPKVPKKPARLQQQKRFKNSEPSDNLYFGSPGLANVIADFANLQIGSGPAPSVTYAAPRGVDIFTYNDAPLYSFPTLWRANGGAVALLDCLPPREELFGYLDAFQRRAQSCSFPHVPEEITRKEIERFLADPKDNAFRHPDMLALIFAALAQGLQNGVYDKSGGEWVEGAMEDEAWKGDLYIAAAMQALRVASFMNRPTILVVETLIMIGPYLTNSGKFLDAWTLFGTTIRVAQAMGLHRSPQHLDPAPLLSECSIRQALWWWMLHMDQQYSMTLGRPLGISGIGDCPPPEPLTTNPTILRVSEYINNFTLLARQILSSDRLTNQKIDDFTDRLLSLRDTLPDIVQFNSTWLDTNKPIPEWPLDAIAAVFHGKTHNYLILLNRQRQENDAASDSGQPAAETSTSASRGQTAASAQLNSGRPVPPGRERVLESCRALLEAFEFFHSRVRPAMVCWTMGQQAFNASMILIISLLRPSTRRGPAASQESIQSDYRLVHQAYATFTEMQQKGIHKLAGLACAKLSSLLYQLGPVIAQQQQQQQQQQQEQQHHDQQPSVATTGSAGSMPFGDHQNYAGEEDVMGNTGMLLLEDPGLQSFIPEAFAPLNFRMAGFDLPASGMGDVTMEHLLQDPQQHSEPQPQVQSQYPYPGPAPQYPTDTSMPMPGAGLSSPGWAARGAPRDYLQPSRMQDLSGLMQGANAPGSVLFPGGVGAGGGSQADMGLGMGTGMAMDMGMGLPGYGRPEVARKPEGLRGLVTTTGSVAGGWLEDGPPLEGTSQA